MTTIKSTPRTTYPQDWPAYNAAQTAEKDILMGLLADLCAQVPQLPLQPTGRPRLPVSDMLFTGALKVYTGLASRRFASDVRDAHRRGYTSATPSFNTVTRYIANPMLTPIITELVEETAAVLRDVERDFAVDASGFSTSRHERWFDHKWGREKSKRQWLKAHICVGVRTNVITAIKVTAGNVHDSLVLPELVDRTAQQFTVDEVSADKAYLSEKNLALIESYGAAPYVPFKSNTTGRGSAMWRRLYANFMLNEAEWDRHYHKRSNVETTFSMVKGKFGDAVRSKSTTGQVNEILLKALCHNLCVVIGAMHRLGLTAPAFGSFTPN